MFYRYTIHSKRNKCEAETASGLLNVTVAAVNWLGQAATHLASVHIH